MIPKARSKLSLRAGTLRFLCNASLTRHKPRGLVLSKTINILRITPHFQRSGIWPAAFDPTGGLQAQTYRITMALAEHAVSQTVLTTHIPGSDRRTQLAPNVCMQAVGPRIPERLAAKLFGLSWFLATLGYLFRKSARFDLIHIHYNQWIWCRVLVLVAHLLRRPVVVTFNTDLWIDRTRWGVLGQRCAPLVERLALRRVTRVFALTQAQAVRLSHSFGVPQERVQVIPDSIDALTFRNALIPEDLDAMRRDHAIPTDRQIVAYVGRIRHEKGWADLPALARICARNNAVLLICGDGTDRQQLVRALRETADPADWRITEFLDPRGVRTALGLADVLILPSQREAFGSVLLEAMACGTASVAYDVGGIPEVAGTPPALHLVPAGDSAAFAEAVSTLLADPAAREVLVQRGFARVQDFSLAQSADTMDASYRSILGRTADRPSRRSAVPL